MASEYVYEERLGPGQIRLLFLAPGTEDVHFRLQVANLEHDLEYEAISYCWGDPADTREVYCDQKPLQVTNSLFTALKQLRFANQPRTLWADAICINQKDFVEKCAQINLMSQIYSKTTRVLIWLGDDTTGLEGVEESMSEALRLLPPVVFDGEEVRVTSQRVFREASLLRKEGKPNFNDQSWDPINILLGRPWFDRKWVIQEVVKADDGVPPGHENWTY